MAAEVVLEFYTFPLLPGTSSSAGTPSYIVFFQLKLILTALIGQRHLIRIKLHLQPWLSKYNSKVEGLQQALNIQIDSNDLKRKRDAASNLKVVFLGWTHLSSVHRHS